MGAFRYHQLAARGKGNAMRSLRRHNRPRPLEGEGVGRCTRVAAVFPQRRAAAHEMCIRDSMKAVNFFSILKSECIYRFKPKTFAEANEMIDRYLYLSLIHI